MCQQKIYKNNKDTKVSNSLQRAPEHRGHLDLQSAFPPILRNPVHLHLFNSVSQSIRKRINTTIMKSPLFALDDGPISRLAETPFQS